jgi:hypothetical protein
MSHLRRSFHAREQLEIWQHREDQLRSLVSRQTDRIRSILERSNELKSIFSTSDIEKFSPNVPSGGC